jgi:Family of unknown function (DUF5677)
MLSKAFSLSKACLQLLGTKHADEAYGLSRSLGESATNLRYLTADGDEQDRRARDFIKYAMADKAYWYHYALEVAKTPQARRELKAYARQFGISPNTKLARQHWSGKGSGFVWQVTLEDHPLDGPADRTYHGRVHAVDYHLTSGYVHCGLTAIDNYFIKDGVPFKVSPSSGHHETYQSTLFTILIHIHASIRYVLHGLNIDAPVVFSSLFQKALGKMEPLETRHSI